MICLLLRCYNDLKEFGDEVYDNENDVGENMEKLVGNNRGITGAVKEKRKSPRSMLTRVKTLQKNEQ